MFYLLINVYSEYLYFKCIEIFCYNAYYILFLYRSVLYIWELPGVRHINKILFLLLPHGILFVLIPLFLYIFLLQFRFSFFLFSQQSIVIHIVLYKFCGHLEHLEDCSVEYLQKSGTAGPWGIHNFIKYYKFSFRMVPHIFPHIVQILYFSNILIALVIPLPFVSIIGLNW